MLGTYNASVLIHWKAGLRLQVCYHQRPSSGYDRGPQGVVQYQRAPGNLSSPGGKFAIGSRSEERVEMVDDVPWVVAVGRRRSVHLALGPGSAAAGALRHGMPVGIAAGAGARSDYLYVHFDT